MRIQPYARTTVEPGSAGGVIAQGAGQLEQAQAEGLSVLQRATAELAERSQAAQRNTDVSSRVFAFRQQYSTWWQQRAQDQSNYATLAADSSKALNTLSTQAFKGVDDPLTQTELATHINEFALTQSLDAQKTQIEQQVGWSRAALDDQLFQRRQELSRADPKDQPRLVAESLGVIRGASAAGYIAPLDAEKKAHAFVDGVAEDDLNLRVYNDPNSVLRDLYSGKYNAMSVTNRERITVNAEKRAEALRSQDVAQRRRDDTQQEKAHKVIQDENFGTYYGHALSGEITPPMLYEALRKGEIRGTQFRQLADAVEIVNKKGGPGNAEAANRLTLAGYRGELTAADIINESDGATGLNNEERGKLLELMSKGAASTNSRDYKQASKFIDDALGVIPGGKFSAGRTNMIAGLAQQELYQRSVADPRMDVNQAAVEIVQRYNKIDIKGKGAPTTRYPTLDAAKAAFRRGDISDREFDTEAELFRLQPGLSNPIPVSTPVKKPTP